MMESARPAPSVKLVGAVQLGGAGWDNACFGQLFDRLPREVKHTGDLTRYVGYRGVLSGLPDLPFFGLEVAGFEALPEGMLAWDLRGDTWTVLDDQGGTIWQESVTWSWFARSPSGRLTGEFRAQCPAQWASDGLSVSRDFLITTNAYVAPTRVGFPDEVYLVDYDPSWPGQFEEMAQRIRKELGADMAVRVEHYGSTAVAGMPAKPVIDILVEIPSFVEAGRRAIPLFNRPQYEYWWYSDHMLFIVRKELMGQRTHHLHLAPARHPIWSALAFRDYLRTHDEEASRYAALKRELAGRHRAQREDYTEAKAEFIRGVTAKASQRP